MKKLWIYLLFYSLTCVSIVASGILLLLVFGILSIRVSLMQYWGLSENIVAVILALMAIPMYVFIFQISQDVNYHIIHQLGYWATSRPRASYRGLTIPNFYERHLHNSQIKTSIQKAQYRYRLFSILQWVMAVVMIEIFIAGYWEITQIFKFKIHLIILLLLLLGGAYCALYLWEQLQKQLQLEIAYVENEREFYCKRH